MDFSPQFSARLDAMVRTSRILWIALMASVAVYGLSVYLTSLKPGSASVSPTLPSVLFPAIALCVAGVGAALYQRLTDRDRLRAILEVTRTAQEEYDSLPASHRTQNHLAEIQALSAAELRLSRVPAVVFTFSILRWAAFEGVAITGVVVGIRHHSFLDFLPYGLVAIALQAMTPPRVKELTLEAVPLLPVEERVEPLPRQQ